MKVLLIFYFAVILCAPIHPKCVYAQNFYFKHYAAS